MRTALVVLVASLAMVLAGCGSTIKPDRAAETVTDFVSKNTGFKPTDTKCPSDIDAKVGQKFDCHFTGPDGNYTAHVEVTKIDGEDVLFNIDSKKN
jgi:outer membrane murein-binding lipoprotein Lpp